MNGKQEWVNVVVCGAHMSGLPLNPQLLDLGGELLACTRTAPTYRLYKLAGFEPPRPGMVRVEQQGAVIDVEVWRLPLEQFGRIVMKVPAPLCIGTVVLEDGSCAQGFLCETYATKDALDITEFGGWRGYLTR